MYNGGQDMKVLIKKVAKRLGLSFDKLITPYYWFPYYFMGGRAYPPKKVTLELTFRCNLKCQMCPLVHWQKTKSGSSEMPMRAENELTVEEIKKTIDELKRLGTKAILLTGGEPFLRKDMREIMSYIKSKGLYCSILSNGTVITKEKAKDIVDSGVDVLSISVDGPENIHNEIRGRDYAFENIKKAVRLIKEYQKEQAKDGPRLLFNCTISSLNSNRIDEVVDSARQLGVGKVEFMYLFYTTDKQDKETQEDMPNRNVKPENQILPEHLRNIEIDNLKRAIKRSQEKAYEAGIEVSFSPSLKEHEIERRFYDDKFAYCSKCFFPWYETRIDPQGNVYPCSMNINMGNIRESSMEDIWNNGAYVNFRRKLRKKGLFPTCYKCCKLTNRYWSYI